MTLKVNHDFVSPKPQGGDSTRIYGPQWNADHDITGTADAAQLNANVVQSVTNDTNIQGSISAQNLTFSWGGSLATTRGGTAITTYTLGDLLYSSAANTLAKLAGNTTSTKNFLTQTGTGSASAAPAWGTIVATDIGSGAALTRTNDTNVTATLGGSPTSALLAATSITLGWTGTLAASRGGFGADVSGSSGVPLFATGVATFTGTTGSGNFARATSPTFVTPVLGTPSSGTLTSCTGLPVGGIASIAANTIVANATGSSASPTAVDISALTTKGSPGASDYLLLSDQAASGALKKVTVSSVGSSSGVSSIAGNTGAFTLANGIDNSTNQIQLTAARRTLPTTQSLTSGTGATYTTPANCLWIEVYMVGGGGGGAGTTNGATGATVAGSAGGTSTFNSINAAGGSGGGATSTNPGNSQGGAGGTGGTGSATRRSPGASGGSGYIATNWAGATAFGGASYFAGNTQPPSGAVGINGNSAAANSGAGGSGAFGGSSTNINGGGGGGGEFLYLIINSPSATYTYTIGAGGGGGAGANQTGGSGGSGFIFVVEHYGS